MRLPRYDIRETALETVIPLSTPLLIYVDPSSACNFQCGFCPTADRDLMKQTRFVGFMDFDLYRKIIDDFREFDRPIDKLKLYCDGEPLLNPRFADMVRYAKKSGLVNRITTTTNASRLSPELNLRIVEAGLDQINISVYGMNADQYRDFSKTKIEFDSLVANIRHLYEHRSQCEIKVKINGDVISREDEVRFYEIFEPIADGVNVEHVMSCWVQTPEWNLAENGLAPNPNTGIHGQSIQDVLVCPYVFYSFTIHPDGTASACFLDWQRKLLIGDVRTQSVKEIWDGPLLREHQALMLQGKRRSHPICGSCGQMSHGVVPQDNIDPHREVLLDGFEKRLVQIQPRN
ncbi:MAG: radical SAM protein [Candidatus Zambryskibacteria bacterium RIFCSPLOWO2_01_FULL_39_39]|uniref:Radical SAM protein n=1 Tax=Candidatus Zambryskibacteria bacterium RIFCSPLOWO2_01_FULL_39_39 TaxID=1802758 RepID=A0A1G2TZ09_9BACT|nr:MAG: radical SAM protein [Candidatus Zambryskibacteria bacterium RIFCSPHIGHO2_01_FULL_39_63]OHA95114.1 MAG: radical SAM protein [Candidatus Zambryskibacteria bacterium RIFCSPHIGHO2_02_FULL_39_19]OHA98234.1 MAG: radical SAM protein [Candidatus Zambryskibacteria bacterium RIFCSPHIGHO2_12_FULL_39_21]OHB02474.1 MAG: radical SAM protein [Candidatus Zambryskibacteria bacterium RIFCSPLOWO2_01_FULL_39_39]